MSHGVDSRELAEVAPELFVPDVDEALRFYTEKLGFELVRREHAGGRGTFAIVALGSAIVMLADEGHYAAMGADAVEPRGRGIDVRIVVADVDAVRDRCRRSGVSFALDIGDRYYGLRDFIVRDSNGYRLRFAAPTRA